MLLLVMIFSACKNAGNNDSKLLVEKKAELQKLTTEKNKIDAEIKKLQDEINLLDTNSANQSKFTR
jgi:cell division protein FtsB